ncbi:hypothetical protein CVV43_01790 [Candidatus Saccharibacteria bacterium HGW-Saccharibacteria-1]|jgi:8-oxo-dGTP pyrophosphatase MutT (NUDIX family)|nr:MAG: hypothetical protein CVV43_01790 [Candidatus Saccharibacteria bacterium HGW-Saccharibacteria-1]
MNTPDLIREFEYKGSQIRVEWFDLVGKDVPDLKWERIYAIGDIDGLVPVVCYENDHDNLPGGGVEPGETAEQALIREIDEELNMGVVSWRPLGYQSWTEISPNPKTSLSLRVCAKFVKKGEFENDPGGAVIGYKLVPLEKLNHCIEYGTVGDRMIELVKAVQLKTD